MKNPIFGLWCLSVVGYLSLANARGWSLLHTLSPRHWGGGHSSGVSHK
jgi:hypothetical protein